MYIVDGSGSDMTAPQDTPVAINKEGNYLVYNVDVFIQKCIDSLPSGKLCKSHRYDYIWLLWVNILYIKMWE